MPADAQLTWGDIKKFMEEGNVPDAAAINLEVGIKGIKPKLIATGWVNGMERPSVYSVIFRHNPKS